MTQKETDEWSESHRATAEEAICLACCRGDLATVRRLLQAEATLIGATGEVAPEHREQMMSFGADKGWSPLHLAAHYGHLAVVKLLIEEGGDVNVRSRNKIGNRPLGAAVAGGQLEVVRVLLASGANVNATDVGGLTPLHLAVGEKRKDIADALIAAGADREAKDKNGRTPGQARPGD